MKRADPRRETQLRQRREQVAFEAARLMVRHGLQDVQLARQRAARQLGITDEASQPANMQVQQHLYEYQRLFRGDQQAAELRQRREAALQAMEFLRQFEPRLVGSVLDGSADAGAPVQLHVFCEDAEAFARFLLDERLPAELAECRLRVERTQRRNYPQWSLLADGLRFEIAVLPPALLRQPPLSDIDDKPMARATPAILRRLLDGSDANPQRGDQRDASAT